MPAVRSAALLVFRHTNDGVEFLLAHPGGPFWKNKDDGAWSIPKGLVDDGEENSAAARREFEEEVGQSVSGDLIELSVCKQPSGKLIHTWMVEADLDLAGFKSNEFEMEWPKGSGNLQRFPEIDRVGYMKPALAFTKILKGQRPILEEALKRLEIKVAPDTDQKRAPEAQLPLF